MPDGFKLDYSTDFDHVITDDENYDGDKSAQRTSHTVMQILSYKIKLFYKQIQEWSVLCYSLMIWDFLNYYIK